MLIFTCRHCFTYVQTKTGVTVYFGAPLREENVTAWTIIMRRGHCGLKYKNTHYITSLEAEKLAASVLYMKRHRPSGYRRFNGHRDAVNGDVPSGRSAASFLPRDSSILGSSRATHSTRHVARVTFWNVDIAIPIGARSTSGGETVMCDRFTVRKRRRRELLGVVSHPSVQLPCWLQERKCSAAVMDDFHHWVAPVDRVDIFNAAVRQAKIFNEYINM